MFEVIVQADCLKVAVCQHDAPKTRAGDDVFLARSLTPTLVPLIQRVSPVLPYHRKEVQWMCII